jgi:carotenoid cleavage dioxygenase
MRSELVIINARTMQECARVVLPFRNAFQVHGLWASLADLALV